MARTYAEERKSARLYFFRADSGSDCADGVYTTSLLGPASGRDAGRDVTDLRRACSSIICARFDGSDTWLRVLAPDVFLLPAYGAFLPALALLGAIAAVNGCLLHLCNLGLSGAVLDGQGRTMERT